MCLSGESYKTTASALVYVLREGMLAQGNSRCTKVVVVFAPETPRWIAGFGTSSVGHITPLWKRLTHWFAHFLLWLLSNNPSLFSLRFSTLLIHRIHASWRGRLCIRPRSPCVTTSPSHSRAKPRVQDLRRWVVTALGSTWVGRGFVEEWETPGHWLPLLRGESRDPRAWMEKAAVAGSLWGHVWVIPLDSVCVCLFSGCIILTFGAWTLGILWE